MKMIGQPEKFAFEYEKINKNEYIMEMYVGGIGVCTYIKNNNMFKYSWDLTDIIDWLDINLVNILTEEKFPLKTYGTCGVELYNNSWNFDSENIEILEQWYEKRQDWYFKHSWYTSRAGSFLADAFFRRVKNDVEISWNNTATYSEVKFVNPYGCYLVNLDFFKDVINKFTWNIKIEMT